MIYLTLAFICFVILLFILYSTIRFSFSNFYAKQNFYESMDDNKNFILLCLVKSSNVFVPVLKNIKVKLFIDYVNKLDSMLKIFDFKGVTISPYNFIYIQIISMFIGYVLSFLLFGFDVLFMICFGGLFLILPYLKIYEQYNKKINDIIKQIPDVANLLSIMIFSGIDFNNSLNKIITILDGYLISELKNIIKKISLGLDTKTAFKEMAEKYNIVPLDTFVKTITISLETGTGLTDSLNKIAKQISDDNISIAERKAHEAPVKMLLPMTILILPTIFILLFSPFVISFFKSGSMF